MNFYANTTSIDVITNIDSLLETHSTVKKKREYSPSHVFYDLYNFFAANLSTDDKMSLHTFFHSCEKSLAEARGKNFKSSQFWLDYTNQFYKSFSDNIKTSMGVLYFPAIAFHKYAQNDYADAIAYTEKSIAEIDMLKNNEMNFIIASKMEQYLNICRVNFAKKDYDNAFQEAGNLLLYVLTGNTSSTSKYIFKDKDYLKPLDINMHKLMINYITTQLILKLYKLNNEHKKEEFFKNLFLPIWNIESNKDSFIMTGYKEFIMALKFYYEENYIQFLQKIEEGLSLEYEIPNILQYLVFDKLQELEGKINWEGFSNLKNNISNYYSQALEFDPMKILGNKNVNNHSPLRQAVSEAEPILN